MWLLRSNKVLRSRFLYYSYDSRAREAQTGVRFDNKNHTVLVYRAMAETLPRCKFGEEDGTCAILRVTDSTPQKPICKYPDATIESCKVAINWQNPTSNPIDSGLFPAMGEID